MPGTAGPASRAFREQGPGRVAPLKPWRRGWTAASRAAWLPACTGAGTSLQGCRKSEQTPVRKPLFGKGKAEPLAVCHSERCHVLLTQGGANLTVPWRCSPSYHRVLHYRQPGQQAPPSLLQEVVLSRGTELGSPDTSPLWETFSGRTCKWNDKSSARRCLLAFFVRRCK